MHIHPTAHIDDNAELGSGVVVGPFSIVGPGVTIGDGSVIDSHCSIGRIEHGREPMRLVIGPNATIRSHTVIYGGSTFGRGLQTGHGALIREQTDAGDEVRVGSHSIVEGSVRFGDHVSVHSSVFVAPDAVVEDFAWLFPGVVLTNDPHPPSNTSLGVHIGRFAAVGAGAIVLPGVHVGQDALVAAGSVVTRNVEAGSVVAGVPALRVSNASDVRLTDSGAPAYPWRRHFQRGLPQDVLDQWPLESSDERL